MFCKDIRKWFCLAAGILGIILIGLGVFLLADGFGFEAVIIGTIVSGILLLVICGLCKNKKLSCIACLLLILITLFLIITGILTIIFVFDLVVALLLIGLGIVTFVLVVICLIVKLSNVAIYKGGTPGSY